MLKKKNTALFRKRNCSKIKYGASLNKTGNGVFIVARVYFGDSNSGSWSPKKKYLRKKKKKSVVT